MLVHNKTTMPLFFTGISVPTGSQTNLQVDRVFSSYLPRPYSDCVEDIDENYPSKLVNIMLKQGFTYSQQNCFLACYQRFVFQTCKCYNSAAKVITGYPEDDSSNVFCTNFTLLKCDTKVFKFY